MNIIFAFKYERGNQKVSRIWQQKYIKDIHQWIRSGSWSTRQLFLSCSSTQQYPSLCIQQTPARYDVQASCLVHSWPVAIATQGRGSGCGGVERRRSVGLRWEGWSGTSHVRVGWPWKWWRCSPVFQVGQNKSWRLKLRKLSYNINTIVVPLITF